MSALPSPHLSPRFAGAALGALATVLAAGAAAAEPPPRLSQTGLYAPGRGLTVAAQNLPFTPQYPLWSDGAVKRRWLYLPPGTAIDASNPDAWVFPPGTRLWKAFAVDGRPVETRFIERGADGRWSFATYVWPADGGEAVLAPARGVAALPVDGAPGGRYALPSRADCLACHESAASPVLGASALQLSPDRDPLAPQGRPAQPGEPDLRSLAARGLLRGLPPALLASPPRIPAASASERSALGTLHGNCAHCHNESGAQAPVALSLAMSAADPAGGRERVLRRTVGAPSRYRPPAGDAAPASGDALVITPGQPAASVLWLRMASRHAQTQMPPLGTRIPDAEALALVARWIRQLAPPAEASALPGALSAALPQETSP